MSELSDKSDLLLNLVPISVVRPEEDVQSHFLGRKKVVEDTRKVDRAQETNHFCFDILYKKNNYRANS